MPLLVGWLVTRVGGDPVDLGQWRVALGWALVLFFVGWNGWSLWLFGRHQTGLLPAWDGTLLCHRDRALTVGPEVPEKVVANFGVLRPAVLVDGRVLGTWKLVKGRPAAELFTELSERQRAALELELADVERFRAG